MISAVLDTNTIISAILVQLGFPRQILQAAYQGRFACFCSAVILDEVERTLSRPRIQRKYSIRPDEIRKLLRFFQSPPVYVPITATVQGVATHPEDDLVLATAVSAHADYLVTGDRQLLALQGYAGVIIVSPRQFIAILRESEATQRH